MKKLLLFLMLMPACLFSQENQKKSAEEFVKSYFSFFENQKFDEVLKSYADDGLLIWANGKVVPLGETMKPYLEKNKTESASEKIDIKWIMTDVTGPNSAMVTVNFLDKIERGGTTRIFENIYVVLLNKYEKTWKIKKLYQQSNTPLIYSENVESKYRTDNMAALQKFNGSNNYLWSYFCYDLESSMKAGISPAELGKNVGIRFGKTWDQSKGFNGLVSGFQWGISVMSSYVEVLEKNDSYFKAKFKVPVVNKTWEFSKEDLLTFCLNIWQEEANFMGGSCTLTEDGGYWILSLSKK